MVRRNEFWRTRLEQVSSYWPRRLLHLQGDRLVSVERVGVSTYGEFEAPVYNILSYTWGRFRSNTEAAERLPIENVSWEIPRVDPNHFKMDAFLTIVKRVAQGVHTGIGGEKSCHHIWLDIACINQKEIDEMLEEIGHQAAIFNRAKDSFIWLSHTPASSVIWIAQLWGSWVSRSFWSEIEGDKGSELVKSWPARHREFLNDPWFTSLWTLQEAFLRPDAFILTQENNTVSARWRLQQESDELIRLIDLTALCSRFYDALEDSETEENIGSIHREAYQQVRVMMDDYGLRVIGLGNAMELYACSDNKKPWNILDKIYGIQQIFGVSLGKESSLFVLEDRLGASLNELNPVIAQAFVHVEQPSPMRSWRITPKIHIPMNVLHIMEEPVPVCKIEFDQTLALTTFSGPTASFEDCVSFWQHASKEEPYYGSYEFIETIYLDQTPSNQSRFPESFFQFEMMSDGWEDLNINNALQEQFGPDLRVLLLGNTKYPTKSEFLLFTSIGLLVYPSRDEDNKKKWIRIGFALWDVWSDKVVTQENRVFQQPKHPLYLG